MKKPLVSKKRTKSIALVNHQKHDLEKDKYFVVARDQLLQKLEKARAANDQIVRMFLERFALPVGPHISKLTRFMMEMNPPKVIVEFIDQYIAFVNRFRLSIAIKKNNVRFFKWPDAGPLLHAQVDDGHLEPTHPYDHDAGMDEVFDGDDLPNVQELRNLLEQSTVNTAKEKINFLQIDDEDLSSILTEMERLAYAPDGFTVIIHQARYPYLFLMIGEQVTLEDFRRLLPIINKIRNHYQGRQARGRPANTAQFAQDLTRLSKQSSMKEKAIDSATESSAEPLTGDTLSTAISSQARRLQRRKANLKKSKN